MRRLLFPFVALLAVFSAVQGQTSAVSDPKVLVERIQGELTEPPPAEEGKAVPGVPHGEFLQGTVNHSEIYPGTENDFQVCDQNGRVRAILPLPTPCGPVRSLCFGGAHVDVLYATDGLQVFRRRLKLPGVAPWAARVLYLVSGTTRKVS